MDTATILLVDDEPNIRRALSRLLILDGHRVLTADSGEAALELIAANDVDILISDIQMPGMAGDELMGRVRHLGKRFRRIVLTGSNDPDLHGRLMQGTTVHRVLTKPWNNQDLRAVIAEEQRSARWSREQEGRLARLRSSLASIEARPEYGAVTRDNVSALVRLQQTLMPFHAPSRVQLPARVLIRALMVAELMGIDAAQTALLRKAALVHRAGELALPEEVFARPAHDLSPGELDEFRYYPEITVSLLDPRDRELIAVVRSHREYPGGNGFPAGEPVAPSLVTSILTAVTEFEESMLFQPGEFEGASEVKRHLIRHRGDRYDSRVVTAILRT
ncbi:MAG: response regulator [Pseudomonadales bacterium]|nr:response regulator [Pseudomonadales bacterium]